MAKSSASEASEPPPAARLLYQVRAADTDEGKQRVREYYEALGKFAEMYAKVEAAVHFALCQRAQTTGPVSRAIFSGVRVRQASSFIKRILEAANVAETAIKELDHYISQLTDITATRDAILHYGAQSIAEGDGFVTDELRAHMPTKVRRFPISPDILDQMTEDLRKIGIYFRTHYSGTDSLAPLNQKRISDRLAAPWQYKRPPLSGQTPRKPDR